MKLRERERGLLGEGSEAAGTLVRYVCVQYGIGQRPVAFVEPVPHFGARPVRDLPVQVKIKSSAVLRGDFISCFPDEGVPLVPRYTGVRMLCPLGDLPDLDQVLCGLSD